MSGHPFIVKLKSISFGNPLDRPLSPITDRSLRDDNLFFVFEQAAYDGHTLIYDGNSAISYLKRAMVQMLLGVEYMHGKGIIHRDLKPSNLLWVRDGRERYLKICDFGLSKVYSYQEPQSPKMVTSWYLAPEIALKYTRYTIKSDMWSIGCILYEFVSQRALLKGVSDDDRLIIKTILKVIPIIPKQETINRLNNAGFKIDIGMYTRARPNFKKLLNLSQRRINEFNSREVNGLINPGTYEQYLNLLNRLLVVDPNKRYSASQALEHPFFDGYRSYINSTRRKYPPKLDPLPKIIVRQIPERKWAVEIAFTFFNHRNLYDWYKHRIIFQAIDLFDRYIVYCFQNYQPQPITLPIDQWNKLDHGCFHTRFDTNLRFFVCIYLSIKYFSSLRIIESFNRLVNPEYSTQDALKKAGDFEQFLINKILSFKIFRSTVFEAIDRYNENNEIMTLDENGVMRLLYFYGTLVEETNISLIDLLGKFLKDDKSKIERIKVNNTRNDVIIPTLISTTSLTPTPTDSISKDSDNANSEAPDFTRPIYIRTYIDKNKKKVKVVDTIFVPTKQIGPSTRRNDSNSQRSSKEIYIPKPPLSNIEKPLNIYHNRGFKPSSFKNVSEPNVSEPNVSETNVSTPHNPDIDNSKFEQTPKEVSSTITKFLEMPPSSITPEKDEIGDISKDSNKVSLKIPLQTGKTDSIVSIQKILSYLEKESIRIKFDDTGSSDENVLISELSPMII